MAWLCGFYNVNIPPRSYTYNQNVTFKGLQAFLTYFDLFWFFFASAEILNGWKSSLYNFKILDYILDCSLVLNNI